MENNNNKWVDSCKLLGTYNDKNVYLYSSCKASAPRIFYSPICLSGLKTLIK